MGLPWTLLLMSHSKGCNWDYLERTATWQFLELDGLGQGLKVGEFTVKPK